MAIKMDKYNKLKSDADRLQREADRCEGVLDALKKQLYEDFEITDYNEGKKLLKRLKNETSKIEKAYTAAFAEFETEWGDALVETAGTA